MQRSGSPFSVRALCVMGILVALSAVLSLFTVYISETMRALSFAYLPTGIGSVLYGPIAAVPLGVASDLVSFFIKPMGPFFPGYMLSAVVQNLIYVLFLYRKPLRIWRVIMAQVLVTVVVTFGLGLLWLNTVYSISAGGFFVMERLVINLIFFPLHCGLIYGGCYLARRLDASYGKLN